jgi:hypothetical protein
VVVYGGLYVGNTGYMAPTGYAHLHPCAIVGWNDGFRTGPTEPTEAEPPSSLYATALMNSIPATSIVAPTGLHAYARRFRAPANLSYLALAMQNGLVRSHSGSIMVAN